MFNYKEFKEQMIKAGHNKVSKTGKTIVVKVRQDVSYMSKDEPLYDYSNYESESEFIKWTATENYNTTIYKIKFRLK